MELKVREMGRSILPATSAGGASELKMKGMLMSRIVVARGGLKAVASEGGVGGRAGRRVMCFIVEPLGSASVGGGGVFAPRAHLNSRWASGGRWLGRCAPRTAGATGLTVGSFSVGGEGAVVPRVHCKSRSASGGSLEGRGGRLVAWSDCLWLKSGGGGRNDVAGRSRSAGHCDAIPIQN